MQITVESAPTAAPLAQVKLTLYPAEIAQIPPWTPKIAPLAIFPDFNMESST